MLRACRYSVPPSERLSWSLAMLNDYLLFDFTRHHLIVSFFHPPLRRRRRGARRRGRTPAARAAPGGDGRPTRSGEHVLVYQTSATFRPLLEPLSQLQRPVIVYGYGAEREHQRGNLTFKPFDDRGILEDLSTCAYAVVNGGHNLICEALHFGKPVLCFPIARLFEQFINAWHVRALGYGAFSTDPQPGKEIFDAFERDLDGFARTSPRRRGRSTARRAWSNACARWWTGIDISGPLSPAFSNGSTFGIRFGKSYVRRPGLGRDGHLYRSRRLRRCPPPSCGGVLPLRRVNQLAQARQEFLRSLLLPLVRVSLQLVHEQPGERLVRRLLQQRQRLGRFGENLLVDDA